MSQENAERLMESLSGLMGQDMNVHTWGVQAHGVKFEAVETLTGCWIVVLYHYDVLRAEPQWVQQGFISSFS